MFGTPWKSKSGSSLRFPHLTLQGSLSESQRLVREQHCELLSMNGERWVLFWLILSHDT